MIEQLHPIVMICMWLIRGSFRGRQTSSYVRNLEGMVMQCHTVRLALKCMGEPCVVCSAETVSVIRGHETSYER